MATVKSKEQVLAEVPKLVKYFIKTYDDFSAKSRAKYDLPGKSGNTYTFEAGSTYAKIIHVREGGARSVVGFVQLKPGKFAPGTILKAAGWKAPATNFGRGDIFDKSTWTYPWTGV